MNKDLTLLILAAGMGSRFGGLKQIEPMGPSGEFIIDYSIYDAIRAGFNKVVFVIKEENYEIFKETIGSRIEPYIQVEYCFQDITKLPEGYYPPEGRIKPWGTAHAILAAKDHIHENFAMINADDFYGKESFMDVAEFLNSVNNPNEYAIIGYEVAKTLTENGSVKRAVLEGKNGYVTTLTESSIENKQGTIIASPLDGRDSFTIPTTHPVSLNMLGFTPSIFQYIEDNFIPFLEENKDNMLSCEYLIPDLLCKLIEDGTIKVRLIPTISKWAGVTYKEDKPAVMAKINQEVEEGSYGKTLWKHKSL